MRKFSLLTILAIVAIVMGVAACSTTGGGDKLGENPDSLMARINAFNKELPITFASENVLDSVYYDGGGNKAVFNLVIDEHGNELSVANQGNARVKAVLLSELASSPEALAMYKELAEGEVNVRTVLLGASGKSYGQVELAPQDILAIKAVKPDTTTTDTTSVAVSGAKRDSLDMLVDSINALYPDTIDARTILTRAQVENNYLVYNYVRDEGGKNGTIDRLKRETSKWKGSAESKLRKPTPEMATLIALCIDNGLGMKHRFVGKDTKQTIDYAFSAVELSKISNHPLPEGYEAVKERIKEPPRRILQPLDR